MTVVPHQLLLARLVEEEIAASGEHFFCDDGVSDDVEEERPHAVTALAEPEVEETILVDGAEIVSRPRRNRRQRRQVEEKSVSVVREEAELLGGEELRNFEYLDHTAEVILHSWGADIKEAFAQAVVALFSYMTDLDLVEMPEKVRVQSSGHDLRDLLFHTLDDFLFTYGAEYHISRRVEVVELDVDECTLVAYGYGERFSNDRHSQGTEISSVAPLVRSARTCDGKAATTDGLQIEESKGRVDCYVTAVIG